MHYLILATMKIPPQEADPEKDQEIREQLAELGLAEQNPGSPWPTDIFTGE